MAEAAGLGARIRARRGDLGLRQTELATAVGISAPYLNLIEHGRRRIGGKLLVALARVLAVEPSALSEGAAAGLVAALGQAAGGRVEAGEAVRAAEFAARFPGWSGLVAAQDRRIRDLEAIVETLSDRLTHDPRLAAALHEVLSVVTAIRATASILSDTGDLDRAWLDRFHRNLAEDSLRLSDSARALVAYLDGEATGAAAPSSPQELFEAWLARHDRAPDELPGQPEADALALAWAAQARADAARMPADEVQALLAAGEDPAVLARAFDVPLSAAFRRFATLPPGPRGAFGLILADAAGAVTFRLPPPGFQMPRLGAACALWPLFLALSRPMQPLRLVIEQAARLPLRFVAWAVAEPAAPPSFAAPLPFATAMLIRRASPDETGPALAVGTTCRVCPRQACPARREPSVLG